MTVRKGKVRAMKDKAAMLEHNEGIWHFRTQSREVGGLRTHLPRRVLKAVSRVGPRGQVSSHLRKWGR